jgi:acyl carrier protein
MAREFEAIKKIIEEHFAIEADGITPDTDISGDLALDDNDFLELTMSLEEEFSLIIPDGDAEKWKTVGDIAAYIARR